MTQGLAASVRTLAQTYDAAFVDLDGVVYVGPHGVPFAAEALGAARKDGMSVVFVTNNASRTAATVAEHLMSLGVAARTEDVVTSAMAVATMLRDRLDPGANVLVVGGDGLVDEVSSAGFHVVRSAADAPAAVVQGYAPDIGWPQLAEAALAVQEGIPWIAANVDTTLPTPRGLVPGNGALVAAVNAATGAEPLVAGKPQPPLHDEAVRRSHATRPLVVGDRLDTDIAGAVRVGADSLLVLTGVTTIDALCAAPPDQRPTYLALDLRGLLAPHPAVTVADGTVVCDRRTGGDDGIDDVRVRVVRAWAGLG